jgi:hypothetical protein
MLTEICLVRQVRNQESSQLRYKDRVCHPALLFVISSRKTEFLDGINSPKPNLMTHIRAFGKWESWEFIRQLTRKLVDGTMQNIAQ